MKANDLLKSFKNFKVKENSQKPKPSISLKRGSQQINDLKMFNPPSFVPVKEKMFKTTSQYSFANPPSNYEVDTTINQTLEAHEREEPEITLTEDQIQSPESTLSH